MLTILITIIAIIGWIGCVYYKGKAKEFESLFELSKGYDSWGLTGNVYGIDIAPERSFNVPTNQPPKLNKDGSIAKKRGRKSKV